RRGINSQRHEAEDKRANGDASDACVQQIVLNGALLRCLKSLANRTDIRTDVDDHATSMALRDSLLEVRNAVPEVDFVLSVQFPSNICPQFCPISLQYSCASSGTQSHLPWRNCIHPGQRSVMVGIADLS